MEDLNEMIKDYLAAKDTDYAVMINGDWGCGKSYYIRNDFQEAVTSVECPARDEKRLISYWDRSNGFTRSLWHKLKAKLTKETIIYDEKKYYPFYISLYGVSSVEDFNARVTDEFFGLIGKGGNMLSSFLDGKFNVRLPFSSGKLIPHNAVLVFDDLERICLDKISPIEVLGLINSFAEHRHLKVVIVCNEEAFRQKAEDGSVQLKLDDEYRQYKEKTIRFTYTCKADIWNVYHALSRVYKNEYGAYIKECTELILALFSIGGKSNIRTLKFFIEIYEKLYNEISELLSSEFSDKILDRMLISTIIYVMEYKQGVSAKNLLKLREPIGDTLEEMFENASPLEEESEKEESETYRVDKVREKYERYYEDMVRLPWLIDYITSGALEKEKVYEFVTKQDEELRRISTSPAMQAVVKLKNLKAMDDEELQPTIHEIWDNIEQNQYTVSELMDIYNTFVVYILNGIEGIELPKEKDPIFQKALELASGLRDYQMDNEAKWAKKDPLNEIHELKKRYYDLVDYVVQLQVKSNKAHYEWVIQEFLRVAEEAGDAVEGIATYRDEDEYAFTLRGMDWDRLYNAIVKAPNPKACMIIDATEHLLVRDTTKWTLDEYTALFQFKNMIKEYRLKNSGKIRAHVMRGFEQTITEYIKNNGES